MVSPAEMARQEWMRWMSWIMEARRQNVEAHLPTVIRNCRTNLDPSIREYDIELSRMIFRALVVVALNRPATEEEMLQGIREGFITALQLKDTTYLTPEIHALHQKEKKDMVSSASEGEKSGEKKRGREFSLEHMKSTEGLLSNKMGKLRLDPLPIAQPRRSRYFTPEQSETESKRGINLISRRESITTALPRDIPVLVKKPEVKINPKEVQQKLTQHLLQQQAGSQRHTTKVENGKRDPSPSPSPSSSSESADERRRRTRKEKERKKKKGRKKKRSSDQDGGGSDDSSNPSSSSDSDVGNKRQTRGKWNEDSSSDDGDQDERATRQQRKDFMAILKANAPKKYKGDRDPKVLREWVNQVDHYMSMMKLTKRDEMRTILLLLEGDAMLWWRRNRKEFKKKGISTWKAVKRLIVDRFMPLGYRLMLEKQLREVCQRTSAREYASRFTHIIMQLPDYTDKQIIPHFINGLKTTVRTQVISYDPTELEEAIRLAENIDDGLFAEQITVKKQPIPDPRTTRVTKFNINQVGRNGNGAEIRKSSIIKCYNCGKLGHISRNCRAPRKSQQQAAINESQKITQVNVKREDSPNDWTLEDKSPSPGINHVEVANNNVERRKEEPPKAGNLLIVYGHIGGKRAKILLDSGATASFVSETFVRLHRFRTMTRAQLLRVFFVDGRDEISLRLLENIPLIIGGYEEKLTFEIANLKYDCILEKNWHDNYFAVTRNPADIVEFTHRGQKFQLESIHKTTEPNDRVLSTLEDVSVNSINRMVRRAEQEVYAVVVKEKKEKSEAKETPPECGKV